MYIYGFVIWKCSVDNHSTEFDHLKEITKENNHLQQQEVELDQHYNNKTRNNSLKENGYNINQMDLFLEVKLFVSPALGAVGVLLNMISWF